jgi:hypothetical protein
MNCKNYILAPASLVTLASGFGCFTYGCIAGGLPFVVGGLAIYGVSRLFLSPISSDAIDEIQKTKRKKPQIIQSANEVSLQKEKTAEELAPAFKECIAKSPKDVEHLTAALTNATQELYREIKFQRPVTNYLHRQFAVIVYQYSNKLAEMPAKQETLLEECSQEISKSVSAEIWDNQSLLRIE